MQSQLVSNLAKDFRPLKSPWRMLLAYELEKAH